MDVTESDWLPLIIGLKHTAQYVLSYPGATLDQKPCGLHSVVHKLDEIFRLILSFELSLQDNSSLKYPGLHKCLDYLRSNFQLDHDANKFFDQLNEVTEENFDDILLIGRFLECFLCFLQEVNSLSDIISHSFLADSVCVGAFLSCTKALNEIQPVALATIPLSCLQYGSYVAVSGKLREYNRDNTECHLINHDPVSSSLFLSRTLNVISFKGKECDHGKHSETCFLKTGRPATTTTEMPCQQSYLPDVVACHTQSNNVSSFEHDMLHKHGETSGQEVNAGPDGPTLDFTESHSESMHIVDGLPSESCSTAQLPEKLMHLKTPVDYANENVHLNLSELLITVIQGRKCGLSRPDLLDSSFDSSVPDTIKSYPFVEGDSLHDIAFSIQDSLCDLGSPVLVEDPDDIHENGGSNTDEEINESIFGDCDDFGASSDWFVSEDDAPQALLPLPKRLAMENSTNINSLTESCSSSVENLSEPSLLSMRRASSNRNRSYVLAVQKYRCSGCGAHAEKSLAKKYRYCEFMGEFFCHECHDNRSSRVIPAYVVQNFNFKKYKVSKLACKVLDELFEEPIFNLRAINGSLFEKQKSLGRCYELRKRASDMLKRLEACPVVWEDSSHALHSILKLFQPHILKSDPNVFSVLDLINVRTGRLEKWLLSLTLTCESHFQICEHCCC